MAASRAAVPAEGGGLHIRVRGRFTASAAMDLAAAMKNAYRGEGAIYVYMGMVTEIDLAAGEMMKRLIEVTCLPMDKIIFTGTKGLLLTAGADGYAAVIATTWHGCGGCRTLCQEPLVAH